MPVCCMGAEEAGKNEDDEESSASPADLTFFPGVERGERGGRLFRFAFSSLKCTESASLSEELNAVLDDSEEDIPPVTPATCPT